MEGGNLLCDGHGNAVSSDFVYRENPGDTPQEIAQRMYSFLGATNYHVIQDAAPGITGVHHVGCWAKLLDEETILVARYNPASSSYARAEQNAAEMGTWTNAYGRPFTIVRVYCGGGSEGNAAGYTNSIILNTKVLVPTQSSLPPGMKEAALQAYRDAMPGYEVIGFPWNWSKVDAIHCRSMGIHDKYMLRVDLAPLPDTVMSTEDLRVGGHRVAWDGRDATGAAMPTGIYFFRLSAGDRVAVRRGVLLRK
jgi:agmatine/peptidylarginine deiminase